MLVCLLTTVRIMVKRLDTDQSLVLIPYQVSPKTMICFCLGRNLDIGYEAICFNYKQEKDRVKRPSSRDVQQVILKNFRTQ